MVYLYALIDPFTNQIRYIGYTTHPKARLRHHINNCNKGKYANTHKGKWISKLLSLGAEPIYKQLAEVNELNQAKLLEMELIAHYRSFCKLTNHGNGGEGTTGLKWSEESKKRKSQATKGILKMYRRSRIEGLNISTGEYKIFTEKTEASEYIGCKESSLQSVNLGLRTSVKGWIINFIKKGAE